MATMSKTASTTSKDIFDVCKDSFDKIRGHVEKVAPQYLQSFTNLQQEWIGVWANFVNSALTIQQQYANKLGLNTNATEALVKVVHDSTDEIIKSIDVENKLAHSALDVSKQNLRTINENATTYAELNQKIINSWMSAWTKN